MRKSAAQIVIASNVAPTYTGGLAAYQRALAELLSDTPGISGSFLCLSSVHPSLPSVADGSPWPIKTLAPAGMIQCSRFLWPAMASRTKGRLLTALAQRAWIRPDTPTPDVVHFVGTGWDFFGFFLAGWARDIGARFTVWPAVHPHQWGDDKIDVRLYTSADTVFCQSKFERSHLLDLGVPPSKLRLCGLFPMCQSDGDANRFRNSYGLGNRPCVLFIGRRDAGKGYPALLKAWTLVEREVPEAILLVAGPPSGEKAQNSSASIRDIGIMDESLKADALSACDIFCLPSAHEAFGIVYAEAWSYAKPVICGTAEASRELVEDGVTGLWASQDPAFLAGCLLRLLKNPAERVEFGKAGQQLQQSQYNRDAFLKNHLASFGLSQS